MIFFLVSCSDDDTEDLCFSFDERQCQTDLWAPGLPSDPSIQDKMDEIESYLQGEGILIKDISVDSTYHQVVCEACHVCPLGPRFYIKTSDLLEQDLLRFDFLNLETIDCDSMF